MLLSLVWSQVCGQVDHALLLVVAREGIASAASETPRVTHGYCEDERFFVGEMVL